MLFRFILPCSLALSVAFAPPIWAQDKKADKDTFSISDLERVEAERDEVLKRLKKLEKSGKKADRELQEIDDDLVAAAADSRRREESAINAQMALNDLEIQEIAARQELLKDKDTLADVLATLMSFGSKRPPALTTSPENTSAAIRAAILMGDVAPKLAAKAEALAEELDTLASLQANIRAEKEELIRAEQTLLARRQEIEALYEEKRSKRIDLAKATASLKAQNKALAGEADTLQALLSSIVSKAPTTPSLKPLPPRRFAKLAQKPVEAPKKSTSKSRPSPPVFGSGSHIQRPAIGTLVSAFGSSNTSSEKSKGQTWQTRAGAHIVSPRDGRVEYAGIFRSYGQILILDLGDNYIMVLAGLDSIYAEVGQSVLSGEPVGRMSDNAKQTPELYIELRHNGAPIDPETLLADNKTKR
ncbi:murein hydrolase activator EnvC family protein [Hirschia litorea]|uniref:Murein hydrolase activator EnvC family protein n=1 Tax=Hirschia litorea TaxID=1199156 RepID=A0ABW2IML3_9PROT